MFITGRLRTAEDPDTLERKIKMLLSSGEETRQVIICIKLQDLHDETFIM